MIIEIKFKITKYIRKGQLPIEKLRDNHNMKKKTHSNLTLKKTSQTHQTIRTRFRAIDTG